MSNFRVIKAPESWEDTPDTNISIFLAGSIEMGKAVDWQTQLTQAIEGRDFTILNPRRESWDSSWEQRITNPQFKEQVVWELDALDFADVIIMYFDKDTMSPISLLELGLYAESRRMIICCPDGYWRKGNVEVVCERFDIPLVNTLEELIESVKGMYLVDI